MPPTSTLLAEIRNAVDAGRVLWKKHALERMMERGISRIHVRRAIAEGIIIEYYPNDYPLPSVLLATRQPEPLHVVVAYDAETLQSHVITAYRPDLAHFEADLMTRRFQ